MPEGQLPAREDEDEGLDWVDRFVLVFLRESMLWVVLIVIVGHVVVFIAPVMLLSVRDRRFSAFVVLGLLGWGTFRALRFDRRRLGKLGQLSALIGVVWVLSLATAITAHVTGIF